MTPAALSNPGIEMALRLRFACEAHDTTIASHLDHVSHYACELGRLAGLSEAQVVELHYATPLHDIGKLGIPLALLNKPGSFTTDEMEAVKAHTLIGHKILAGSPWPVIQCAARIALSHHESWDGSGYPHGLRGEEIPLDVRIVSIADVYDALLSRRVYKPAWEEDVVLAELRRLRGVKFDPALLDLFLENVGHLETPAA